MATGRTDEPRTLVVTTTSGQPTITAGAGSFSSVDVGRTISGTGITAGTTILSVQSGTGATMSANATASGSPSCTLGRAPLGNGFVGWSPETAAENAVYNQAGGFGATAPSVLANSWTPVAAGRARG